MSAREFVHRKFHYWLGLFGAAALVVALLLSTGDRAGAQDGSPLHPTFPLLDAGSQNVLESGQPVSTMQTCGSCHDTDFIAEHSFHADVGLSNYAEAGFQPWDTSPGLFGRWDPLTYRYLSPEGDEQIDLTTAEWIQTLGLYHAGGGPAMVGRDGTRLTDLPENAADVEMTIVDPATGELVPWNWAESGVVEMNCFLCHMEDPDNAARIESLQAGDFGWANTATLAGTGIVEQSDGAWHWNEAAFTDTGELGQEFITLQDPDADNCGQCHGEVHTENQVPLVLEGCETTQPGLLSTTATGQVFSPQVLANTGTNFAGKEDLSLAFDVHAERAVECTNCHFALNNPVYYREAEDEQLDHLTFDPRRIDLGEYLYRPVHEFAKGSSAQSPLAPELDNTLRRCESCHDASAGHDWLPYLDRHTEVLGCETCHIPRLYGPARQTTDWTVLTADGTAPTECRGVVSVGDSDTDLFTGFTPVLLPREDADGALTLAPHNLIVTWFWVYGQLARPVPLHELQAAWFDGDGYAADVLEVFDTNGDGALGDNELVLDTDTKTALIAARLEAQGLDNPRIQGEVRPYTISHNVTTDEWAIRDCDTCHSEDSRLTGRVLLADYIPNNVKPTFVGGADLDAGGELSVEDGALYYVPRHDGSELSLYVFGHDNVSWVDTLGALMFLGVVAGVSVHSGARYFSARRRVVERSGYRREYMYSVYERQWHWLQTIVILLLLFTGLVIHKPGTFGMFSFRYVVEVHNILAAILVINAALAAFYHLASGEIRQYLPQPRGFFGQAFAQALYYLHGIFRGEPHPFEKTPDRKMNPLQQVTYLAILNILLPLQVITGLLMWGAQTWPDVAKRLGGLTVLAPFHTLIAWSLAAFIVMHVYLTTTERTPVTGIKSMITGWSELEVHKASEEA